MRMTIEQDIKVIRKMLAFTDLSVRANLTADMVDACEDAISTMRKYQKIEQVAEKCNLKLLPKEAMSTFMKDVLEVLEDGNYK